MMKSWVYSSLFSVFSALLSVSVIAAQDGGNYSYALLQVYDTRSEIQYINPSALIVEQANLANEGNWSQPVEAFPSPDGSQIAVIAYLANEYPEIIRLAYIINAVTNEISQIRSEPLVLSIEQIIAWSPDSQFLAFNAFSDSSAQNNAEIWMYTPSVNSLQNVTNDDVHQFNIAWKNDSSQLVTYREYCADQSNSLTCERYLEIVSLDGRERTQLSVPYFQIGTSFEYICELDWSRDGRYISFAQICDNQILIFPKEIYLYDLEQGIYFPVTNNTGIQVTQASLIIMAQYNVEWISNEALAIGSATIVSNPETAQTTLYNVETRTSTVLSSLWIERGTVNPVSSVLAGRFSAPVSYREVVVPIEEGVIQDGVLDADGVVIEEIVIEEQRLTFPVYESSVQLFSLASLLENTESFASIIPVSVLPGGCDLSWSPDGTTLAYTIRTDNNCAGNVERIIFVDAATGEMRERAFAAEGAEGYERIVPIGWVAR